MDRAIHLYESYGRVTGFKNFQGNPMPEWDDLTDTIKSAWAAAADACLDYARIEGREHAQIRHAIEYSKQFQDAGIPGHGQFLLIAKLALALGYSTE